MDHKIILFDGVCNLCNSSVTFVIKRDKQNRFKFTALQSDIGKELIQSHGIDTNKVDSIIFIENGKAYTKSTAALRISKYLGGAYPVMMIFMIFPPFLRNIVYDWIARNRYKWYGKKESCMIPTPELKSKFL
ncbi:thiol-disulfide oxidoreductase DCC family protein [Aureisphaera galaxeae]|uniref:thiol-disulfide oxidoreductase DCC family protein n=1 Tax=Aureisphaera galaxeae TaxID=1538023 RepID=UPI00235036C1|nr:thiol-disulfide oxidoreductase DCC family protein [Aureisphaera galaxeae]MDC8004201.1 thiol-disulfide oxidoreductase DCC family protein [Aureisphaera galaxeae]